MDLPALYDCEVCRTPIPVVPGERAVRLCRVCIEFRALLRAYIEQVDCTGSAAGRVSHVSALSLKRLLAEARKA
jgi:LSD1 subclass zinc finger protein